MGSEQSSARDRADREYRERAYRESAQSAATARDVERALEQQRKLYEQRMKVLLQENKRESAAAAQRQSIASSTPIQPTVTKPLQNLCKPAPSRPAPLLSPSCSNSKGTPQIGIIERQRTPYNCNQADLGAAGYSSPQGLYPNIDSGYSTLSPGHTVTTRPGYNGFVYVNNCNTSPQQASQVPQPAPRYQPSAPPAPTFTHARSQSRQRQQEDDDIKCPTCGQRYLDKIFQCNRGHSSCALCHARQVLCGHCRSPITTRRNYDLEKYIGEKRVKCPNADDGCCLTIKISDMETHARECPFKGMQCPSLGSHCTWSGKPSQLSDHFDDMHPTHRQGEVDKEMLMSNITDASHTMHYIRIGPFNFLFHVIVSGNKRINMAVQLIGTKHSASKWNYEIHVYKKSEPRRKFQHVDRCLPYSEPIQDIVSSAKCAVIPLEYANTFICGGVLTYKFFIKKDEPITKDFKNENRPEQNNFANAKKGYKPRRRNNNQ